MDVLTLDAQPRELGTAAARAVRRQDEVPCVLYGPHQEPIHFRLPVLAMRPLIFTSETHRVSLELEGESYDCIVKSIDFHPMTDVPVHADFYALTAGEEISMTVPIQLVGSAPGIKAGGILSQPLNEITVRCFPKDIPGHVEIDVSEMEIGSALHVSDITVENATIETDPTRTVVIITAPRAEEEPEEAEDMLLEGETLADGEEAEGDDEQSAEGDNTEG